MNIQENIDRIKEVIGVITEAPDKKYHVAEYFKSRAPYRNVEGNDNTVNLYDKDGILVSVYYKNRLGKTRGDDDFNPGIRWVRSENKTSPIVISTQFMNSLLSVGNNNWGLSKFQFERFMLESIVNYFNIQTIKYNNDTEDDLDINNIGVGKLDGESIESINSNDNTQTSEKQTTIGKIKETMALIQQKQNEIDELQSVLYGLRRQIKD